MKVVVTRPHLHNFDMLQVDDILEVPEFRAREMELRNLGVPLVRDEQIQRLGGMKTPADRIGARPYPKAPAWWPDWRGETCIIIASGPSAGQLRDKLATAHERAKIIAINTSWQLAPNADVLYACDFAWWRSNGGVKEFRGLKISQDAETPKHYADVKRVESRRETDTILLTDAGVIGWGGNSGFQALNLAAQFAASKIILVGYDLTLVHGMHWHGKHPDGQNNPLEKNVERWRRAIDGAAIKFDALKVPVFNVSPLSALRAYRKMTFEEALACSS